MNLTPVNVIAFGIGVLLIYCAIKDYNPKDVVVSAFGGPKPTTQGSNGSNAGGNPNSNPNRNAPVGPPSNTTPPGGTPPFQLPNQQNQNPGGIALNGPVTSV